MRWIEKSNTPPNDFKKWKKAGGWYASYRKLPTYNSKAEQLKHIIKDILLNEQGYICCYCEERLSKDNSHIEHVKPKGKSEYAALVSDYYNLLCSCNTSQGCGNAKDNIVIDISPLDKACETSFSYSDNGEIQGVNQIAENIIKQLELDSERLTIARKGVIDEMLWELPEDITEAEYDTWIKIYLLPNDQGHLPRFWSAIKQTALKYQLTF